MLKKSLLITTLCAASANLCAAATVEVSVDTNNTIHSVVANSIIADGEGIDWTGGVIRVDLTSGFVHNGAPDSFGPQAAFWAVPGFEQLEWDSWFGVPFDGTNGVAGATAEFPGTPLQVSGQTIRVTWFNTTTTDTGPTRIGNVSLTDNAAGTWSLITSFAGGVLLHSNGDVVNGAMVPEPASLGLLGLGILGLIGRPSGKRKQAC